MKKILYSIVSILSLLSIFMQFDQVYANQGEVNLRFLNASVDSSSQRVDVYINKEKNFSNISFKEVSRFIQVSDGKLKIKVYPEGADPKKEKPLLSEKVKVKKGESYTISLIGEKREMEILLLTDDRITKEDKSKLRIVHFSPDTPSVNIFGNGNEVITNLEFGEISAYGELEPTTLDLEFRIGDQGEVLYKIPNLELEAGVNYSIFALGSLEGEPGFDVLITQDTVTE
ncbi:DUF4397 domain-containing protein [Evansella tamaricis]|uniref:DUF4397 domain-containing protein n=1 Tax=Evansella tamaricis TaxID=2069301 RepID=A0ABS6JCK7_9BACI|nr:DUF4397 domain-containing protein [Evansella tamaricis]MBU9711403.1 DUF4397 domain-containing protein [Evansella tamaricis]